MPSSQTGEKSSGVSWRRPSTARCTTMLYRSLRSGPKRGGKPSLPCLYIKDSACICSESQDHPAACHILNLPSDSAQAEVGGLLQKVILCTLWQS